MLKLYVGSDFIYKFLTEAVECIEIHSFTVFIFETVMDLLCRRQLSYSFFYELSFKSAVKAEYLTVAFNFGSHKSAAVDFSAEVWQGKEILFYAYNGNAYLGYDNVLTPCTVKRAVTENYVIAVTDCLVTDFFADKSACLPPLVVKGKNS